jgi:TonB family protein
MVLVITTAALPVQAHAQAAAAPRLENADRIPAFLRDAYPEALKLLGLGGTVVLELRLDPSGAIDSVVVEHGSGIAELDVAAQGLVSRLKFSPPREATWVQLPFTFQPETTSTVDPARLPRVLNGNAVRDSTRARLPESARRGNIGVTLLVLLAVDGGGQVTSAFPAQTTCLREFNDAALYGARLLEFNADSSGSTQLRQTVATFAFFRDSVTIRVVGEALAPPRRPGVSSNRTGVTVFTQAPRLRNETQVSQALQELYPRHLRYAGVGGSVGVRVFVDERGRVARRTIKTSSGECALDFAALAVAERMRFTPAQYDGEAVPVWVDLPIVFRVGRR